MKWYKHDPTAFLEGVIGLTAEERGFYITLINLLYARDGHNVTDELVCSAIACRPQVWRRVKARLIACGKVREVDGKLTANRVDTTLVSYLTSAKINDLARQKPEPYRKRARAKGKQAPQERVVLDYRDKGVDYRSPPGTKVATKSWKA